MSLDVQVKIEGANQAVTAADKVTTALGKTEDKGPAVGESVSKGMAQAQRAVTNLGNAFRGLDAAMNARARATQVHSQMTNTLAKSMGGVVEAMQREQRILNELRGPMQRYEQDLQAINALHARGAITANEHASAMARARSAAGMGNAASTISLPGMPTKANQQSTGGMGLGGMAASVGVTLGAREVLQMADSYTGLENRMRQVSGSHEQLQRNMARVSEIAKSTRSDISTTGESFVRLHMATRNLGVSQERAFKITETLNMALQSSGASSSEAAAGTLQLMQALGAGALQGDEFRSVAENMPMLLDVLSKQLGVSRGELKKMGAEGKITTKVMIDALEVFGPQAKKTFEQSEETFAQFATGLKNAATEFIGSGMSMNKMMSEQIGIKQKLRIANLEEAASHDRNTFSIQGEIQNGLALAGTYGTMTAAQSKLVLKSIESIDTGYRVAVMLKEQLEHMENLRKSVEKLAAVDLWGDSRTGWQKFVDRVETRGSMAMAAFKKHIDEVQEATKKAADEMQRLSDAYGKMLRSPTTPGDIPGFDKFGGNDAYSRYVESEVERLSQMPEPDLAGDLAAHDGGRNPWDKKKRPNYLTDMWNRELDEATKRSEQFRDDMRGIFQDVGQSFIDAAFAGRMEWDRMFQSMTMNMVKLLAMQALRSQGLDTSLLGGLKMPGFASGGSFMVGGNGGTDTTPVAFMATPGERVTVETPGQQRDGGSSGGPLHLAIHIDGEGAVQKIQGREGQRAIVRTVRKMNRVLKSDL